MRPTGPSPAVIVAAVTGILFGIFFILVGLLGVLGLTLTQHSPAQQQLPPSIRTATSFMLVFFVLLSLFGLITCVYVLRLKNWARITMIVWGSLMAGFSGLVLLSTLLLPKAGLPPNSPLSVETMKVILQVFYGIPLFVGGWWVVLFTRPVVRAQFDPSESSYLPTVDPVTGAIQAPVAVVPPRPRCPLPLTIVAYYLLFSATCVAFLPLLRIPPTAILFAHVFRGKLGLLLLLLPAVLFVVGAIGMLKLQRWGFWLVLGLQFFGMISGAVTVLSSNFDQNMREAISQMNIPQAPSASFMQTRSFMIVVLLPIFALIWILLYYHKQFEEACRAKEALQRN
jgi:hypothetical protein